jgi:TIR domain
VIEEALDSAKCVVVLWSKQSISSDWVKDEAEEGNRRGILVPVSIEEVKAPLGFRRLQTANLVGWKGDEDHPEFGEVLSA